jgi:hypothetical protein
MTAVILFWLISSIQFSGVLCLPSEKIGDTPLQFRAITYSGLPTTSLPISTVYHETVPSVQSAAKNSAPDTVGVST